MLAALLSLLLVASPADSLARDVGVAAIIEPGPPYVFVAGDTLRPRVLVRNYGTEPARNFDVRFRIDPVYERTIVIPSLAPGTGAEVRFDPWLLAPGQHVVTCTTRLSDDENPDNDRARVTIRVLQPPELIVGPDRADRIEIGATGRYQFYAEVRGDMGDSIRLLPPPLPPGWRARYYDSTGTNPPGGADRLDLGYIAPQQRCAFTVEVSVPAVLADTNLPTVHTLALIGIGRQTPARDSALLALTLVPGLDIHNYPNPFATRTTFIIGIPADAVLNLTIFDRVGTLIRRVIFPDQGPHPGPAVIQQSWDGTNEQGRLVAPGAYQYLLEATWGNRTRRIQKRLVVTRE